MSLSPNRLPGKLHHFTGSKDKWGKRDSNTIYSYYYQRCIFVGKKSPVCLSSVLKFKNVIYLSVSDSEGSFAFTQQYYCSFVHQNFTLQMASKQIKFFEIVMDTWGAICSDALK